MKAQYNTFEQAEKALVENSSLKNKKVADNVTSEKFIISSMIIFPHNFIDNGKEIATGYDIAVFFKNQMSFVTLNEIADRFSLLSDMLVNA